MAASQPFTGFTPDAIQFLADLAQNNDRAWFNPRKATYERLVKEPMEGMIEALAERLAARGIPLRADPKRSPFRIYRDTRFSRDKSPYKTHLGATFPWVEGAAPAQTEGAATAQTEGVAPDAPTGAATVAAEGTAPAAATAGGGEPTEAHAHGNGGYFHFEPGEMFAGGGMWLPAKPKLEAFRQAVVNDPERVGSALDDAAFVAWFGGVHSSESLKRVPPGYPADHPMAERLRWKDVVFGRPLSDAEVCSPELPNLLAEGFAAAIPIFRFLATLA
jgi:uncharacterized protein (DUF2461 family)